MSEGRTCAVFDDGADPDGLAACMAGASAVALFSLAANHLRSRTLKTALEAAGVDVEEVPSARLLDEEAARLAADLPAWTARLSAAPIHGRPLTDWLDTGGVSLFWLGSIAERNPLKNRTLHWVAQARAFDRYLAERTHARCVIAVREPELASALAGIATARGATVERMDVAAETRDGLRARLERMPMLAACAVLARQILWSVMARGLAFTPGPPVAAPLLFVTYYPYVDKASAEQGRFVNKFAGPLQDALDETGRTVYWACMFVFIDGWTFRDAVALTRRLRGRGERVALLDAFFGARECWRVITGALRLARRARQAETTMGPSLGRELVPAGADALAVALWRRATSGPDLVRALYYREVFARLLEAVPADDILYYLEFQGWEQALNAAGRAVPGRRIGVQHTAVSRNHYFYFRTPGEASNAGPMGMPMPSLVAANGTRTHGLLAESGFPDLAVLECVRQMHLSRVVPAPKKSPASLLVAGSIDRTETLALFALIAAAFPGTPPLPVEIKAHPSLPAAPLFAELGIDPVRSGYTIVDGTVGDALAGATIALVGSSAVAIEALAYGCEVIVPASAAAICMSPLTGLDEWHHRVFSPEDLRRAVSGILSDGPSRTAAEKLAFVRDYWLLDPALPKWRALLKGKDAA